MIHNLCLLHCCFLSCINLEESVSLIFFQEEEERKRKEEQERKEHEEYLLLKEQFTVEDEGIGETAEEASVNTMLLIYHIKWCTEWQEIGKNYVTHVWIMTISHMCG